MMLAPLYKPWDLLAPMRHTPPFAPSLARSFAHPLTYSLAHAVTQRVRQIALRK
ncbi:hypothetical protein R69927_05428 [Paraburkholderia domus]|uniref:Uncharacterized protein n=1 Tax=Paraburkholderia domus TaxID=2793075 RepID=A0A9N8MQI0_9BURK|nr:hypothetical protein R70006_04690 [Paraburkholderia domus]CAE6807698.1 hypothetical protein R75483_05651 [Paraburkholderia domus]CAE6886695.1 hypothetical protein R70211_02452 [Paraburkholderia domus]CAE6896272.1 hypothetical protein R75471_02693 [Paraburkholderia domus]CAE6901750.1 hypothetical protein R69927_05428 [Paraburkholderia domus]